MTNKNYFAIFAALILLLSTGTFYAQSASDGFKGTANNSVSQVAADSVGNIYIAGPQFTAVNGVSKSYLARLNRDGVLDTTYNPNPNAAVQVITTTFGGKLVVAGSFTSIGGAASGGIARLNSDGTNDGAFTAAASGIASVAVAPDSKVLIGGHFTTVGGQPRNRLARFNANGTLDASFTPDIDNAVFGIAIQPDGKILIAGQFASVNGQSRWSFARLNDDGSLDTSFNVNAGYPGANGTTYAIDVQADGKIVVTGAFTRFGEGNTVRSYLARINPDGTMDATFTPNFSAATDDVRIQPDGRILVGGTFTTVNGANAQRIVRLNMNGTIDTSFVGSANDSIFDIDIQVDGRVLLAGAFTSINGFPSINRIASLYPDGRLNADTVTTVAGSPPSVMVSLPDGRTLMGGGFTSVGGAARQGMARLGWTGANDSTFANPQFTGGWVNAIAVQSDGKYIVGGDFTSAGGTSQAKLARLNPSGSIDGTFAPTFDAGGWVGGVAIQSDGKILIGGGFTTVNGTSRTRIARLNATGTVDTTFTATADFLVDVIAIQSDGKILIGGAFENVNGQPRVGIARLNTNGTLDTSFNPVLNGLIRELLDIKIDKDGKILIGGAFTGVNGNARTNLARLNADGSLDTSFGNPNLDGAVHNIAETVLGPIYISGGFTSVGGSPRTSIALLNTNGTLAQSFADTVTNEKILAMTLRSDGKIMVGGYFSSIGGQARGQFAAISYPQPAIYDFQVTSNLIRWYRWWYAPQVTRVVFERSDDGVNYVPLGNATRSAGNWDLAVPNANATGYIRARGYYGDYSERGSVHEVVRYVYQAPTQRRAPFDFDGDGKTDISIFRPGPGEWWYLRSSDGGNRAAQFGLSTDVLVPGDYTGDGKADFAFYRPSIGEWFIIRSEDSTYFSYPFGTSTDIPAPADYDGDGKTDSAVFRPSNSTWYIRRSSDAAVTITTFGAGTDKPVPADYDGDGKADLAMWRPSVGEWWYLRSSDGGNRAFQFGNSADRPTPGDFTGDGKADLAYFRPSTGEWFVFRSEDSTYYSFPFGSNGDVPSPGDYDGDGRFDAAVFRPSLNTWFLNRTTAGVQITGFGAAGDRSVPGTYVP
ncbi:MAG: FG-GAP-like repeat-containing protein [Pyrinomonadaceae bacterium]|nr:FG-GAP-like repeat-containing protein [Pyrinomonadaceae bacterium]